MFPFSVPRLKDIRHGNDAFYRHAGSLLLDEYGVIRVSVLNAMQARRNPPHFKISQKRGRRRDGFGYMAIVLDHIYANPWEAYFQLEVSRSLFPTVGKILCNPKLFSDDTWCTASPEESRFIFGCALKWQPARTGLVSHDGIEQGELITRPDIGRYERILELRPTLITLGNALSSR